MTEKVKTTPAARLVGVPVFHLFNWIHYGMLQAPERDSSGHFLWGPQDLQAARELLEARQGRQARRQAATPAR